MRWEPSGKGVFTAATRSYAVSVELNEGHPVLCIHNETGELIEVISAWSLGIGMVPLPQEDDLRLLSDLYDESRRQALQVDSIVDTILQDLAA